MNCPKCKIELTWGGWILATDSEPYSCFGNPNGNRIAPCWKCKECGYSYMEKDKICADCGGSTNNEPIYWMGTSARCKRCHCIRMTTE